MAEPETFSEYDGTVSVCWKDGSMTRRTPGGKLFTVWPRRGWKRDRLGLLRKATTDPRGSSSGPTRSS